MAAAGKVFPSDGEIVIGATPMPADTSDTARLRCLSNQPVTVAIIGANTAPAAAPMPQPPRPLQLPASGQWFQLDEKVGDETLYVLASTQRLDVGAAKQQLLSRTDGDVVRAREPPPEVTERNRGEAIQAALAADGTALLSFPLRHR